MSVASVTTWESKMHRNHVIYQLYGDSVNKSQVKSHPLLSRVTIHKRVNITASIVNAIFYFSCQLQMTRSKETENTGLQRLTFWIFTLHFFMIDVYRANAVSGVRGFKLSCRANQSS